MFQFSIVLIIFLGIQFFVTASIIASDCTVFERLQQIRFTRMMVFVCLKTIFIFTVGIMFYFSEFQKCATFDTIIENINLILNLFLCYDMINLTLSSLKNQIDTKELVLLNHFVLLTAICNFRTYGIDPYIIIGICAFFSSGVSFLLCVFELSILFLLWGVSSVLYGLIHPTVSLYYDAVMWTGVLVWITLDKRTRTYDSPNIIDNTTDASQGEFETIELH